MRDAVLLQAPRPQSPIRPNGDKSYQGHIIRWLKGELETKCYNCSSQKILNLAISLMMTWLTGITPDL